MTHFFIYRKWWLLLKGLILSITIKPKGVAALLVIKNFRKKSGELEAAIYVVPLSFSGQNLTR